MHFPIRFFWQSKFAIPRMNWYVLALVMIKIVTQMKLMQLVTETGQVCVTEMLTEIGSRVAFIYALRHTLPEG